MSDAIWYYAVGDKQRGPVTLETLRAHLASGVIDGQTLIWREGMGDWEPAIRHLGGSTPPPLRAWGEKPRSHPGPGISQPRRDPRVGFGEAVSLYWSRYFEFSGRSSRSEYWWATLFVFLAGIGVAILDAAIFPFNMYGPVSSIFSLVTFIPGLAMSVRRLHDLNRSGWWLLLVFVPVIGWIVLFVWTVTKGDEADNRFG